MDKEVNFHEDVAPPLHIKTCNAISLRKGEKRQHVLKGRQLNEYIKKSLTVTGEIITAEVIKTNNVWSLSLTDRWRLYRYWLQMYQQRLQTSCQVSNIAILRENVLQPFMSKEHLECLLSDAKSRNIQAGQLLSSYLGVVNGKLYELLQTIGPVLKLNYVRGGLKANIAMLEAMNSHEEACTVALDQPLLQEHIAKALAHFDSMSNHEVQSFHNVFHLSYRNRWRLYKHWLSIYRRQLQERLTASQNHILREDSLKSQMTKDQYGSLKDPSKYDNIQNIDCGQLLILWLQAYSGVPLETVQEIVGKFPEDTDKIDVKEAAELLAEARYIEDEGDEAINHELEDLTEYSTDEEEDDECDVAAATSVRHREEWKVAGRDAKSIRAYLLRNLRKSDRLEEGKAVRVTNVWELQLWDRWNLYRYWVHLYKKQLQNSLLPLYEEYEKQARLLKEFIVQENVEIVREAKVIALTTTGAAKYHTLVERVHPKIVIVEEAAEVLEAHIVTSLTGKCQHLILIGDHQQLRPNPTVYELSTRYGLDISLFERLIKNGFPSHRLNLQHRMRPEISQLLKIHKDFYPDLRDHESVLHYDNIQGIVKNIFLLDHTFPESRQHDDHSRSNRFEAEFLTSLCRYLLQQDYKPEQITILTAYAGQLWNFKSLMPKSVFKDVRVCPVDSYQGEENDIILLSLVRSNEAGSIGFLKTANRVCVALSRAKKGLYCVGNFSLLSRENNLWKLISSTLLRIESLGKSMKLMCANHPHVVTEVSIAQDFKAVPDGGCSIPCKKLLDCGHVCTLSCHPGDSEHIKYKCRERCRKPICELNHVCGRLCFEECKSQCKRMVHKQLVCGHRKLVMCFQRNSSGIECQEPCRLVLKCSHPCKKKCGEECTTTCRATVKITLRCGHEIAAICGKKDTECPEPCLDILRCGHRCLGTCGRCRRGRLHVACIQPCSRTLICGHKCTSVCSAYCPPCEKRCENCCIHNNCSKKCGQVCTPCQKPCEPTCPHKVCRKSCSEPCSEQPCNKPCRRILKCGHECIGLCGEKCPAKCRICDKIEVSETEQTDDGSARYVQLEDCGHIIEMSFLDKWMSPTVKNEKYSVIGKVKECPKCKAPIRKSLRYMHLIKQAKADVEHVKKQITQNEETIEKKRSDISQKIKYAKIAAIGIVPRPPDFYLGTMGQQTKPKEFSNSTGLLLHSIQKQLNDVSVNVTQINSLDYKVHMLKELCGFKRKANNISDRKGNDQKKRLIEIIFLEMLEWVGSLGYVNTQNEDDWNCEVKRISALLKLMEAQCRVSATKDPPEGDVIKSIYAIVQDGSRYSVSKRINVLRFFRELARYDTSLKPFEEETKMVVNIAGWVCGHWLKCHKGHIYFKEENTSAKDRGKCRECEIIVGVREYYRLDNVKKLTTAMACVKLGPDNIQ